MKVIADTNIWYDMGEDPKLFNKVKSLSITPSFVNIYELSNSRKVIDREDFSRSAIQMLFKFKQNMIYEPPFIHLAKLHTNYFFNPENEINDLLKFTSAFARGDSISIANIDMFFEQIELMKKELKIGADYFNIEAEKSRKLISKRIREHRTKDTIDLTGSFLSFCVKFSTFGISNLEGIDLDKIELLVKTLDCFFKTIETSDMKFKVNDWFDFAILAYVQPDCKYWTRDKKWVNLIIEAGCEKYLYND